MGRHFEVMPRDGLGVVLPPVLPSPLGIRGGLNMACFSFTGSNYAIISGLSTNLLAGGSFTISFRIQCAAYTTTNQRPIYLHNSAGNYVWVRAPRANAQTFACEGMANAGSKTIPLTSANAPLTWTTVHVTYDHTTKILTFTETVFGSASATAFAATFNAAAATFYLGNTEYFRGKLADIRLYSAVVTPNHSIPMTSEANGVAWYITPKADGSIVDSLGNGNALTTTGGTLYGASGGPGLPWWPA